MAQSGFADRRDRPMDFRPTLPAALRRAADRFAGQEFLAHGARRISFSAAERESAALARGLLALGLGKASRVGLMMPNSPDWVLAWLASARMGALTVAMSSLYQPPEIAWALRHNDIDTLFVAASYMGHDYLDRLERALPGLADQKAGALRLGTAPYLRRILVWGANDRPWASPAPGSLLNAASASPEIDDAFLAVIEAQVMPADDFMVICTSGTTAEPKAVAHTHGAAMRNTWAFGPLMDIGDGDRIYNTLPFFWVGGILRALAPALFDGAAIVFSDTAHPADIVDVLIDEKVTVLNLGAGVIHGLRAELARRGVSLPALRAGFGPPLDRNGQVVPRERRAASPLGMTETFGTHSAESEFAPVSPRMAGGRGRPMPGIQRRIVSVETGEILGPGEEGELQVRGPTLMRGYLKREREEVLTPDGFFATGDRCSIDEDGCLWFTGRVKELIKCAGANVSPLEVEAVLVSYPEVREALVFGLPDPGRGQAVAAAIVPEPGAIFDADAVRRRLKGDLSAYKVPTIIVELTAEEVPRTDTGKPKKEAVAERVLAERRRRPAE
ncbi:MAG TPA: class I adenylate-forming enzyme family protein [Caulobacteraceae bacterium]|nr:class I adenylate-forming enzyme family protein [Caulobacteraceae bacterium]